MIGTFISIGKFIEKVTNEVYIVIVIVLVQLF